MHHQNGESAEQFHAEVPVGHAVHGIQADPVKPQLGSLKPAVGGVGGSGQCAAADGGLVHPAAAVRQPVQIPQQHHGIGHPMVAEGDGLRPLQMCVAGHDRGFVGFGLGSNGANQLFHE